MTDLHEIAVSIKGKRNTDHWSVFHGSVEEVREDMIAFYGMDVDSVAKLPGNEIANMATKIAHGEQIVATVLGATPVSVETGAAAEASAPATLTAVPDVKPEEPQENPNAALIEKLSNAESIEALKKLWAEYRDAFSDAEVKAAYSARGKALKSA